MLSRFDIDQLRFDLFPQARLESTPGHQIHFPSHNGLQPLGQRHKSQPDRRVHIDLDIHIAVRASITPRHRAKERHAPQREIPPQLRQHRAESVQRRDWMSRRHER